MSGRRRVIARQGPLVCVESPAQAMRREWDEEKGRESWVGICEQLRDAGLLSSASFDKAVELFDGPSAGKA